MIWISPKVTGVIFLCIVQLRSSKTNEKFSEVDPNDPHVEEYNSNLKNRSDLAKQFWEPIQGQPLNHSRNAIGDKKHYFTKVNVFESYKIGNKSQIILKQSRTNDSKDQEVGETSSNRIRTSRLANPGNDYNGSGDEEDFVAMRDIYPRQKHHRHSKRVRIIKPAHYLLPPRKDERSGNVIEDNSRQFYRIYQTQYVKSPKSHRSEEIYFNTKAKDTTDAVERKPRIKQIRRRPINYLRPPVITLTTTEHIFYIKPKETTPSSFIDRDYPSSNEEVVDTSTRNSSINVTRSLSSDNNLKPIKYSVIHSTATEMNQYNQTPHMNLAPYYNNSAESSYNTDSPSVRTFNFADNPVTVYTMKDIFGFGGPLKNEWQIQHNSNTINDSGVERKSIAYRMKGGRETPIENTRHSGTLNSTYDDSYVDGKDISWPITNDKSLESTTSTYTYSDEVFKSSSFIPDDVTYVTNDYRYHKTGENLPMFTKVHPGIPIQDINDMITNGEAPNVHKTPDEAQTFEENHLKSTKEVTQNLISPAVQKAGMTVSKLSSFNNENKYNGENYWQKMSRLHSNSQTLKPNNQNPAKEEYGPNYAFYYQEVTTERSSGQEVKLSVAESAHFRKSQSNALKKDSLLQQNNVIPGEAGSDYPILSKPPLNSRFMCKADGRRYVADVSSGCQVFFMCVGDGPGEPMLCPNGTLFSQDFLVCDWWYNVECRYP